MDDTANETAAAAADTAQYIPTLVGGNTYTFRGVKYERGVAGKPISADTKAALEERAVDNKLIDGEYDEDGTAVTEPRQKFKFAKVGEDGKAEKTAATPTRRRASR